MWFFVLTLSLPFITGLTETKESRNEYLDFKEKIVYKESDEALMNFKSHLSRHRLYYLIPIFLFSTLIFFYFCRILVNAIKSLKWAELLTGSSFHRSIIITADLNLLESAENLDVWYDSVLHSLHLFASTLIKGHVDQSFTSSNSPATLAITW